MIPFMDGPAFGHEIHKWIYGYAYWDIYIYKYIYTGGWIHLVMDLSRGRPFFIWDLYDWGL
jgi:hypothetical protein